MAPSARLGLLALLAVASTGITATVPTAEAQYFGRNKVQYESFDFEVLKTDHFDIYYYPEEELAIEYAALMAERWYARLSRLLNHKLSGRQALILYAAHPHFQQTNALSGTIGEGTGGATEILKRRIVLPFAGPLKESDHVIGHELVHAFQFDITGDGGGVLRSGIPAAARLPLWFIEGMAEYLSVGPNDGHTAMWMRDAVRKKLPDFRKLNDPRFFPYRYGQALWAYVSGRWGDEVVGRVLKASRLTGSASVALGRVLRINPDTLIAGWHRALKQAYEPLIDQTQEPDEIGRRLLAERTGSGFYNLAPALSPNAQDMVFLSEKDLFSIEMFLANVETGQIQKKILKTALDPHFEGLQSISSAGSWDYTGERFAFVAIVKGQPVLSILDVARGKVQREIAFPELGEIFNPTWSPNGRFVAFSSLAGGLSDLLVYDLERDETRRLTNDAYADLQPTWSPDGSRIAFVTDRFSIGLSSLLFGDYQLALVDPASGAIEELPAFPRGKHINPQWSPDGNSVYFISDQNGIANIYRLELASRDLFQVTNLYTGASGITALSPALSVASESGEIAFSVYKQDGYDIYIIEEPDNLAGEPVRPAFETVNAARLPPENRFTDSVNELLSNAFFGLPGDTAMYETDEYHAGFGLDYIGQPSLVVGADRFGTYIGGGASLFWSDMLGAHNLATALQVNGGVKDISALVGYTNLQRRWNWGLVAQQIPYRSLFYSFRDSLGFFTQVEQIFRQINRNVGGTVAYPLNRSQRLEFTGTYTNVTYNLEERAFFFDAFNQVVVGDRVDVPLSFRALNLGQGSGALVYDNSFFGIASPILGQRYRAELGGTFGTLNYWTALADYRRYFLPVWPFTLAFRVMHYGRYGADAGANELSPLFIGWPNLVRGYSYGSFEFRECVPSADESCPVFDQLFGTRMAVANAELRFPPFAIFSDGGLGFFPLELAVFFDAGLAWQSDLGGTTLDERAFFLGGDRKPVTSFGFGGRLNLFGLGILEIDWVKPFQRQVKGSHVQFGFTPGF
jgi:Tol biopolymer transport system component